MATPPSLPLRDLRNPRAYFRSSNADTLTLHSDVSEARLTFYNSLTSNLTGLPNFVVSACNETLQILKDNEVPVATFERDNGLSRFQVPGGEVIAARFQAAPLGDAAVGDSAAKAFVLRDYNRLATNQYVGFGLASNNDDLNYRVAASNASHRFLVGDQLIGRIQSGALGAPQFGIGAGALGAESAGSNAALDIQGDAYIAGDLTVAGTIAFDRSGLATLDPDTLRVPLTQLPTALVYTDSNAKIDPSLFPSVPGSPLLRSSRNVGIGTRFAHERLHVQGSAIISERLGVGIGTATPAARLHLSECNVSLPALRLDTLGGPLLDARFLGSNTLFIGGHSGLYPFVGVGTTLPIPHYVGNAPTANTVLSVSGNVTTHGIISSSNVRTTNLELYDATVSPTGPVLYKETLDLGGPTIRSFIPFQFNAPVSANVIQSHGAASYVHFQDSSTRVDGNLYLLGQMYVLSDARVKTNIQPISDPLTRLAAMRGYTYNRTDRGGGNDGARAAGLLAQEVLTALPEAIARLPAAANTARDTTAATATAAAMAVNYDAIVPLLVECIHALQEKINELTPRNVT